MDDKIIDTNVPLAIADNHLPLECQQGCLNTIRSVLTAHTRLVLDNQDLAIQEYRRQMYPDPTGGLAEQFLMHVLNHRGNEHYTEIVEILIGDEDHPLPYPQDNRLDDFDRSDRKWVSIALAYNRKFDVIAPIVNATDSDWLHYEEILVENGINIEFLCRQILKGRT